MPEPLITSNQPVPSHPTPDHARAWRVNFTRRSDVEFRELLERLPVGAYTCDPQGLITYFNEAAVRLWGREPKLNDPADRFCGSFRLFTPDGVPLDHEECWMALAIRERIRRMSDDWKKRGYELSLGMGIAQGYATIGAIGFEGRVDYGAIGTVTNLACRLCAEAPAGHILISQTVYAAVEHLVEAEPVGDLRLKGFQRPVRAYDLRGLKT